MNFHMFKLALEKAEEPEIKLPPSTGSLKKQEFLKNIYVCFIDYAKAFDCVDHNKLWKILQEIGIPDHLTCLLRNLNAGQEGKVRTEHGWVILHCVYVPKLCYPFICWWVSRLLPCPGYYKQCCDEHWGTCVSFNSGFLGVYAQQWDCWVIR